MVQKFLKNIVMMNLFSDVFEDKGLSIIQESMRYIHLKAKNKYKNIAKRQTPAYLCLALILKRDQIIL